MTAVELKEMLCKIDLNSLSDEELVEIHEVILLEENKIRLATINRKHFKTHNTPNQK